MEVSRSLFFFSKCWWIEILQSGEHTQFFALGLELVHQLQHCHSLVIFLHLLTQGDHTFCMICASLIVHNLTISHVPTCKENVTIMQIQDLHWTEPKHTDRCQIEDNYICNVLCISCHITSSSIRMPFELLKCIINTPCQFQSEITFSSSLFSFPLVIMASKHGALICILWWHLSNCPREFNQIANGLPVPTTLPCIHSIIPPTQTKFWKMKKKPNILVERGTAVLMIIMVLLISRSLGAPYLIKRFYFILAWLDVL